MSFLRSDVATKVVLFSLLQIACRSQKAYAHFLREDWTDVISLLCQYLDKYPQVKRNRKKEKRI